eukprot:8975928-Pyramimonas_sp.AAC.1
MRHIPAAEELREVQSVTGPVRALTRPAARGAGRRGGHPLLLCAQNCHMVMPAGYTYWSHAGLHSRHYGGDASPRPWLLAVVLRFRSCGHSVTTWGSS